MSRTIEPQQSKIAALVWDSRYRQGGENSLEDSLRRVAHAVASVEPAEQPAWERRFLTLLESGGFLPGGRILANAGTRPDANLFNCFVMECRGGSATDVFQSLQESATALMSGGGVGLDLSDVPPTSASVVDRTGRSAGPVACLHLLEAMCVFIDASTQRAGAMMACLRCDHPDIFQFVGAKQAANVLPHFNLSVLVTDAFMHAVAEDADWPLRFPALTDSRTQDDENALPTVGARMLWEQIARAAHEGAEPGILFIDRINADNALNYCEQLAATNPCGEVPLPPYGGCNLGSLILPAFVRAPFTNRAVIDFEALEAAAGLATRFLDNVIDLSGYPLPLQRDTIVASRRIGLGFTGLADALIMLGLNYGEPQAAALAGKIMRRIRHAACRASVGLAREKGAFPRFDPIAFLDTSHARTLPQKLRDGIARDGLRNSHLTAIAPTGSISLLAGNVSSGVEPVFAPDLRRRIRFGNGVVKDVEATDYAVAAWRRMTGTDTLPPAFISAGKTSPQEQLEMLAALQPHVDSAIAKTVHAPADAVWEDFRDIFNTAWRLGLKGCAVWRPNALRGGVFSKTVPTDARSHCRGHFPDKAQPCDNASIASAPADIQY